MCIAFAWQAINSINRYADLRTEGKIVQGRWTASYIDPFTNEEIAAYAFVVDEKTYRGKQPNQTTANQYAQGQPVNIVYWVSDPKLSRVVGTEGYSIQNLIELVISIIIGALAGQFIFAYHRKCSAWILILKSFLTSR